MENNNSWFVIINPTAGNGEAGRIWPVIERQLQDQGFSYTAQFTERRGHATLLADTAVLKGYRYILGIGGDGTNHEICNGILAQQWVAPTEVRYALLPVGTGNDWARQWHLLSNPAQRLARLREPKLVVQDAGLVEYQDLEGNPNRRYFVNVAGMAYDAFIAQKLENQRITSKVMYLGMVAKCLFDYELLPAHITFDGQETEDFFYTINIGLCRYSGGGMQFVPQAVPDDGLFALTYARKLPKWEVIAQTPRFYNGTLLQHPKVEGFSAKKISVTARGEKPTLLEADGEFLGQTPAVFTILEKALTLVL